MPLRCALAMTAVATAAYGVWMALITWAGLLGVSFLDSETLGGFEGR